jgi:hypothetical protein
MLQARWDLGLSFGEGRDVGMLEAGGRESWEDAAHGVGAQREVGRIWSTVSEILSLRRVVGSMKERKVYYTQGRKLGVGSHPGSTAWAWYHDI